ncbi:MAG: InlB B-repeat-containing protein, partial [Candidatus Sumerlaeota bacterium]
MQKTIRRFAFILAFAMAFPSYLCAATIEIGSGSVASGQNVVLPVFLDTADCAAVQLRLQYDDSLLGAPLVLPGNMVGSKHRLDWNAPQPGKVNLCITPEDPVTTFDQGGVLCYLIFSVDATTGTITQITEQAVATGPPQIPPTALSDINGATISPGFIHGTVTVTDQTGSLQVDLSPSDAVSDGAAWRRIGQTAWRVGGETESDVPVGDCYIEFKGIPGWIAPASQSLAINQGALSQTNAVYQPRPYYLNYAAGQGGTLSGTTSQTVYHGQNGSTVEAVGDSGYHFVEWSDGVTDNPRTDLNVTANIDVTARFALHDYLDAYYVVYSNRDSDVQPRYYENGIYLPASEGSGILKIIRQRGKTD